MASADGPQQQPLCFCSGVVVCEFAFGCMFMSSIRNWLLKALDAQGGPTLQTARNSGFRITLQMAVATCQAVLWADHVHVTKPVL